MSRQVTLVLLCEDKQHEAFLRRFFETMGWPKRRFRIEKAPSGRGSAEGFVRERFPIELEAYRQKRSLVKSALVVMVDGDTDGVAERWKAFDSACKGVGILPRQDQDHVAMFVPTWSIETWNRLSRWRDGR
jgi:hypothetical protein